MSRLAINHGKPVRERLFPPHITIGQEEKEAVGRILDGGILSSFLGTWHEQFLGGQEVRMMETEWAAYFGVKHAIAVNSCTSGLFCATGAIGLEPGDEVIVTPYTMSATAMAPLVYNAIPIFADVESDRFCLDPTDVEARITDRTRAIIVVDLFGQPYDAEAINAIARKHELMVIEDCAQAPGARLNGRFAGTLGHVGVFSLNYHKHIHSGEGGVVVTDDDRIANRVRLIRNHAESVVEGMGEANLVNMIGFNFRMTEIEAAIARCQLRKLADLNARRLENVHFLEAALADIPAIIPPVVREGAEHVYYLHACKFDQEQADGLSRNQFVRAVAAELPPFETRVAEGVKINSGYVKPLYLLPLFQQRMGFGSNGYPFNLLSQDRQSLYAKGCCPRVEALHEHLLFTHEFMLPSMTREELQDVVDAFYKVWTHRAEIRA